FEALCALVGAPELKDDPRFHRGADRVKNNDAIVALLQERLSARPTADWLALLHEARIPAGPVLHYDEALTDPQILARDMVVETEHPETGRFRTLGVPVKLSETPGGAAPWRAHRRGASRTEAAMTGRFILHATPHSQFTYKVALMLGLCGAK